MVARMVTPCKQERVYDIFFKKFDLLLIKTNHQQAKIMVAAASFEYNLGLWKEEYELYGDTLHSIRPSGISDKTLQVVDWHSKMLNLHSNTKMSGIQRKKMQKQFAILNTVPGWKWKNALFKEQLENFIAHRDEEGRKGLIARHWFEKMTSPGKKIKAHQKAALQALPGFTTTSIQRIASLWSSKETPEPYLIKWHSDIVRNKEKLSEECIEVLDAIPNWTWNPCTEWVSNFEKSRQEWENIAHALDRAPSKNSNDMAEKESALWARKIKQKFDQNLSNKRKLLTRVKIEALNHTPHWEWNHKRTAPKLPFQVLREKLREKSEQWSLDKSSKESRTWKKSVNVAKAYGWLSQDEIDMVGSLSGWTWDEDIVEWGINECLRFYTTALHDPFSDKAFRKLERWQKSMRDLVDNGQLHESVIDKLITLHALEPLQRT
jgi:hypothetical protein